MLACTFIDDVVHHIHAHRDMYIYIYGISMVYIYIHIFTWVEGIDGSYHFDG